MKKKQKLFSILLASSILLSNISPIITYATDLPNVSTKETSSESSDLLTSESSSVENPKESTVETTNSSVESTATTSEETQHSKGDTTQSTTETTTESSEAAPAEDGHDSTVSSAGNQISAASLEKTVDIASFVEQYSDTVINIATSNNLYPSVMMAQGILESAAGTSELAKKANNLFGMKFKEKEDEGKYDYVLHDSYEYINGEEVLVTSKFRKYASCYDSFKDNALKLKTGTPDFPNRYENVWRDHTNSYLDATQGLVTGGYATSPDYAKQLNSLIETWHLQKLDQSMYSPGWQHLSDGWYYVAKDGSKQTGWIYVNEKWYYLNSNGIMQTNWIKINGKWYHLDYSGAMTRYWAYLGNNWYYFNSGGVMQTDWLYLNNKWYYLDGNGAMQTDWQYISNKWYHLDKSGVMSRGWLFVDKKWYYLNSGGVMQRGWLYLNNKWYYTDSSGAMKTKWQWINNHWYYFYADGSMAKNTVIDGHHLNSNGTY